jgi:hypothetical protein
MDRMLCLNSTDDELLVAVAKGDSDAFAVLEVFLEFWRQAPRLDRSLGRVATWLLTTPLVSRG